MVRPSGITVRELVASLLTFDQDLTVDAEGCDCINPVSKVSFSADLGTVLIGVTL